MKSPQQPTKYYPGLDGLRGISCLIVVFTHNFGFSNFFEYGWLGVDLFFVISGFLITTILLDSLNSDHYLRDFYVRRLLRIFPLYYLMLLIFILILPQFNLWKDSLKYFRENQWWFWTYTQNWLMIFKFPDADYLNHFWSLSVEEQFYIVWPLIILWLKKPKRLIGFILFMLIGLFVVRSFLWHLKIEHFNYTVFYRFTRIDGICIGSLCALIYKVNKNLVSKNVAIPALVLAVFNFLFYFANKSNHFDFPYLAYIGYTTFSALLGLVLNEVIQGKFKLIRIFFNFPPLRFIGKISYSLYVFHWPVFSLTHIWFANVFQNSFELSPLLSTYFASICATLLGFVLSVVSYYYFEKKFLYLKQKFK